MAGGICGLGSNTDHCREIIKGKHKSLVKEQPEKSIKRVCVLAVFNQLSTLHCDLISLLN